MQALYLLALDPVAETTADPNSYGFRPGRSTADAIEQCFTTLGNLQTAQWVLEGDIKSCFDGISHEWLLTHIPIEKAIVRKWLKSGYIEKNILSPTEEGTPQGGIITPPTRWQTLGRMIGRSGWGSRSDPKNHVHVLLIHFHTLDQGTNNFPARQPIRLRKPFFHLGSKGF